MYAMEFWAVYTTLELYFGFNKLKQNYEWKLITAMPGFTHLIKMQWIKGDLNEQQV